MREVDTYMDEHRGYRMVGREFVCPECAIDKLCSEARFFHCIEDLDVLQLRPELRLRFFNVMYSVLATAPSHKIKRI